MALDATLERSPETPAAAPAPRPPAPRPSVGIGLFVHDRRGRILLLRRQGSHGAGCWGLVGGHLEHGQTPEEAAAEEALQEVGLRLDPAAMDRGPYTNDVFADEGKHYLTLYLSTRLPRGQQPRNLEPGKCTELGWFDIDDLPEPLFVPVRNFLRQPVRPPFGARRSLPARLLRHLRDAAVIYATLFAVTFLLAVAAAYAYPWLLDPVPTVEVPAQAR